MSAGTDTYTVTFTGRQVAELFGILVCRQDLARRMAATTGADPYWTKQVDALENLRQALASGVGTHA